MRKTFTYKGKRYSVSGKTEEDIEKRITRKKQSIDDAIDGRKSVTFSKYADAWLSLYKEPFVVPSTVKGYRSTIRSINEYIGDMRMVDIDTAIVQKLINSEYGKGYGKSKIDKTILTLRQIFRRAVDEDAIKKDPTLNIIKPKIEEQRRRALTDEEYNMVLEVCKTSRYGLFIKMMLLQGLRPAETSRIKCEHIDLKNMTMYVDGTKSAKAKRTIPLSEALLPDLRRINSEGYLFTTNAGKSPSKQARERWWGYFVREVNLHFGAKTYRNKITEPVFAEDITMYSLRHTFATRMSSRVPINILADLMGHSNIDVTRKYYIHYNEENFELARKAMNK